MLLFKVLMIHADDANPTNADDAALDADATTDAANDAADVAYDEVAVDVDTTDAAADAAAAATFNRHSCASESQYTPGDPSFSRMLNVLSPGIASLSLET